MTALASRPVAMATPRRERLAEALACVTDIEAATWAERIARGVSAWRSNGATCQWFMRGAASHEAQLAITDPREAWEVLCTRMGLDGWVEDEGRVYVSAAARPVIMRDSPHGIELSTDITYPATVADCVLFASDTTGILAAEAIVREAASRNSLMPHVRRFTWRVENRQLIRYRISDETMIERHMVWHAADVLALGYAMEGWGIEGAMMVAPAL